MKAVFDTNVLISALITLGKPKELFQKVLDGQLVLITSQPILSEFQEIVRQPKIRKYAQERDVTAFLNAVRDVAEVVTVQSDFRAVSEDPDDDIILQTALDGKADIVVSGDKHLLSMVSFRCISILTVEQTLKLLTKK